MEETSIGRDQPLIAHDEAAEMAEPGERALHNPPPPIAAQLPAILVCGPLVVGTGGNDGLNTPPGQPRAQGIAVIPPVRDQAVGALPRPAGFAGPPDGDRVEGRFEERDFRRGSRLQGLLPAEYPRHRPEPSTSSPCRVSSCRPWPPFFGGDKAAISKAFIPAELLRVIELGQEGPPELQQYPRLFPLLKPSPTGAGTAIWPRQLAPLRPGPEDPENALQATSILNTRASAPRGSLGWRQMDADRFPLLLAESSPRHGLPPIFAWQCMAL
jgi:hypothetical protein